MPINVTFGRSKSVSGSTTQTTLGGKSTLVPVQSAAVTLPNLSTDDVKSHHALANHLRGIVDAIRQLARTLVTIFTGGVHLRGQTFTANTTKVLSHSLGRPYLGVTVTSRSAAGIETIVALTGGMTSDRYIALQFTQTGTYDVLVF
jgi:hypothetical protein